MKRTCSSDRFLPLKAHDSEAMFEMIDDHSDEQAKDEPVFDEDRGCLVPDS